MRDRLTTGITSAEGNFQGVQSIIPTGDGSIINGIPTPYSVGRFRTLSEAAIILNNCVEDHGNRIAVCPHGYDKSKIAKEYTVFLAVPEDELGPCINTQMLSAADIPLDNGYTPDVPDMDIADQETAGSQEVHGHSFEYDPIAQRDHNREQNLAAYDGVNRRRRPSYVNPASSGNGKHRKSH